MTQPVLVILGACGGIGRALVSSALAQGYAVIGLDMTASLEQHPLDDRVTGFDVDATSLASLKGAAKDIAKHCGRIDGFVNLCGYADEDSNLMDRSEASWRSIMDVNLDAAFYSISAIAPLVKEGGAIVQMGSDLGMLARPGYGPYGISKAGISMLTRQLAMELAPKTRVNCVSSSAVDTDFLRGGTGRMTGEDTVRLSLDDYVQQTPLERLAAPEDITGVILFLLSDAASFVTGQTIHVNGGRYMAP